MLSALHESVHESARAFPHIPRNVVSQPTRGGNGAGGFDNVSGDGIGDADVDTEASAGVAEVAGAEACAGRRRYPQTLASIRRYPPVAGWTDSRLQLPQVSKAPLDGAT